MTGQEQASRNIFSTLWSEKRIVAICFFIAFSQFQYGFDSAAVSGFQGMPGFLIVFGYADSKLPLGYNISTKVQTLIQSLMQLGGLLASICIFLFGNKIGRRLGLWIASGFGALALAIQIGSTHLAALYVGRLFLGISNGLYLTYSITYMSETAPTVLRGSCVGMVTFQTTFGALIGILIDNYTTSNLTRLSYQIPLAVMFAVPVVLSAGLLFLYDTPRYYVSRGREDKAVKAIGRMRGITDQAHIDTDVAEIKAAWEAEVEMHRDVRFKDTFKGTDLRRTLISIGCALGQTATGIIFLSAFSVYFYIQAEIGSPFVWVMIGLAIALTGNLAAFPVMRYIGRRTLLVSVSLINTLLMLCMGIAYTVSTVGSVPAGKALVGLSTLYTWMYGIGQGPVLWAVQTEVPSQRLRSQTVGLGQALNFIFAWLCAYCTPYFINPSALNWGPKYCYIWAGSNLILGIWVFFFVPETRGMSLEQLDELFVQKVPARKFARYRTVCSSIDDREDAGTEMKKDEKAVHIERVESIQ